MAILSQVQNEVIYAAIQETQEETGCSIPADDNKLNREHDFHVNQKRVYRLMRE